MQVASFLPPGQPPFAEHAELFRREAWIVERLYKRARAFNKMAEAGNGMIIELPQGQSCNLLDLTQIWVLTGANGMNKLPKQETSHHVRRQKRRSTINRSKLQGVHSGEEKGPTHVQGTVPDTTKDYIKNAQRLRRQQPEFIDKEDIHPLQIGHQLWMPAQAKNSEFRDPGYGRVLDNRYAKDLGQMQATELFRTLRHHRGHAN